MKLKAPENSATHVSFEGHLYEVKDGVVDVPDSATELVQHGFSHVTEDDLKPNKAGKKETAAEKRAREKLEAEAAAKGEGVAPAAADAAKDAE